MGEIFMRIGVEGVMWMGMEGEFIFWLDLFIEVI
jgi:hypothetical protein